MLQKLGDQIAHALDRAHETEQRAAETADPELKASYQDIARRYRRLAESFQFVESLERFLMDARRRRDAEPPAG